MASTRSPDWTREEVILAMDLYISSGALDGGSPPGSSNAEVIALSATLKALNAYPPPEQGDKYRNPEGVGMKLANLLAVETDGRRGMKAFSQLDAAVWRDYIDDLPALKDEAEAIRRRLADHVLAVPSSKPRVRDVPIEKQNTERYLVHPSGEPREAERAEQGCVLAFETWMNDRGFKTCRREYTPIGEVRPIYCDAWVPDLNLLIEAKNSDGRFNIRTAIGQLYDYRRFHDVPPRLAVLLPYEPSADTRDLLSTAEIEALWPWGAGYRMTATKLLG